MYIHIYIYVYIYIWRFPKLGVLNTGWFIWKIPLGVPLFQDTSIHRSDPILPHHYPITSDRHKNDVWKEFACGGPAGGAAWAASAEPAEREYNPNIPCRFWIPLGKESISQYTKGCIHCKGMKYHIFFWYMTYWGYVPLVDIIYIYVYIYVYIYIYILYIYIYIIVHTPNVVDRYSEYFVGSHGHMTNDISAYPHWEQIHWEHMIGSVSTIARTLSDQFHNRPRPFPVIHDDWLLTGLPSDCSFRWNF